MDEPWFRRFGGFGYLPITRHGWLVLTAMAAVCIPFGLLFVMLDDSRPLLSWISGCVAFVGAIAGHAVVVWKLDRNYRR